MSTCVQLDESISFTPDVIDEQDTENSSFEDVTVSVCMGNVVDIPGGSCKGGEIPLEDQDGFES